MKVKIKEFDVDMEVKTKGIEFAVADTKGKHQGNLVLTKTSIIWCAGKTQRENGKKLSWKKFMEMMDG